MMSVKSINEDEQIFSSPNAEDLFSTENLQHAVDDAHIEESFVNFSQFIRRCRDAIGFKRDKAAKHCNMEPTRLKYLEAGIFKIMPKTEEIIALAQLYGLDPYYLELKAKRQIDDFQMYHGKVEPRAGFVQRVLDQLAK